MATIAPTAQPGDICILVEPCLQERRRLYAAQTRLQSLFGGRVCSKVHVTCQRFNVKPPQRLEPIVDRLCQELATWQGFPMVADSLISFHADFWQSRVLRWQIQDAGGWHRFRSAVESLLAELGCPAHYPATQATTCAALESISPLLKPGLMAECFPYHLFTAHHITLSQIEGPQQFTSLNTIELTNAPAVGASQPFPTSR